MTDPPPSAARASPSTARNSAPILEVLKTCLPSTSFVLEIAAGAGEHAVHNAAALPGLTWQPTDFEVDSLSSIEAWRSHAGLPNVLPALRLDAADPESWPVQHADAIVNINMIHISPWAATEGLMTGAGRILPPGGVMFLYGPFIEAGVETAPSNAAFDMDLRRRIPEWGLRDLAAVVDLAGRSGLELSGRIAMPANNLALVFRRV